MEVITEELADGVTTALLVGRLDIAGADAVDLKLNVLAGSRSKLVLDLSQLSFLASMGLRSVITCARTVHRKGGKMALACPPEGVAKVLTMSGVDEIVPVHSSLESAIAFVRG